MKIKFLGTGTSTGVPEIGCQCKVCTSKDTKNRRLRASVLVSTNDKRILIDCGPDFRQQIIDEPFDKIDAVLITHEHYDHMGGLDDLRPFSKFGDIDLFSNSTTIEALKLRIPYCFNDRPSLRVPAFRTHAVESEKPFSVSDIDIQPINIMHFKLQIYGYRIGKLAYLTDVKEILEEEYSKLKDLDLLVIDALRLQEHVSHQTLMQALEKIQRIAPKKAYLTHMSHQIGLHEEVEKALPENVFLSYDGLELTV